jgi:alkylation response protein AidB-like acyl-CoA dehydrogenase
VRVVRTPSHTHTLGHRHPVVGLEKVRVPAKHLVGSEGGGMSHVYEWFRFERLMVAAMLADSPTGRCRSSAAAATCGRHVAERFFRELRVERIWEGASDVQRLIIADQLAKRGRAQLV